MNSPEPTIEPILVKPYTQPQAFPVTSRGETEPDRDHHDLYMLESWLGKIPDGFLEPEE